MADQAILEIESKGDIFIAISEAVRTVKVSSNLLIGASPVFKIMLGPNVSA